MKRRGVLMLASLVGAAIASAGAIGVLSPFNSAAAGPPQGTQADALNAVLAECSLALR
jgi:hypothetical protein